MNLTTWLNEQSLLVRNALLAGNLGEARNALRFVFEDEENDNTIPDGIRPDMIIRLALFPMSREVRRRGAHGRGSGLRRHAGRGRHRPGGVVPPVRGLNSNNQPNEKRKHS